MSRFVKPVLCLCQVISGHQLPYKSDSSVKKERELSIHIRVAGVEADTFKAKTKAVKNNGIFLDLYLIRHL